MTTAEPPEPLIFLHLDSIINKQNLQEMGGPAARHSYYYCSFSCFYEKIFSKTLSFCMMLFPPREAMTTAEPPEPFASFVINVLFNQYILLAVAARRRGILSILCVLWTLIC